MSDERKKALSQSPVAFDRARLGAETPLWERTGAEPVADCRVFQVRRDFCTSPRDGSQHDFYCLEMPDWINIIPLTANNEVVMIEQYRHGVNRITLEIPGGIVDVGEDPRDAALRELREETGYRGSDARLLGSCHPNPAIQDNQIHTFITENVEFESAPVFDSTEHTTVRLVPLEHIPALIADGTITHALVIAGFHWLALSRGLKFA
jgi:8-oxo-dGTP pyrophosphatase MutT (NUDIX family)